MGFLKDTVLKQGMKLLSDPRVMKVMQDERVMKVVMTAMGVPGKAQSFAKEKVENLAKAMALATRAEVRDLQRTVRRLEEDLRQIRSDAPGSARKTNAAE